MWCSPFRQGLSLKNFLVHSQLSTMICAALPCSLSTGTRIRIGMHGCDNTFRLSSTVSRFSYISRVVNSQRAGPEVRFTSQPFVLLFRASLQRLPISQLQEGMGVKGVTLPLPRAVDTDSNNLLLNLLMDHCYLKLHVSKKNANRYWKSRSIS